MRRAKKEEGKEVNTKEEGKTKREGLKVLTAPDDVEVVIKHACENSEGTLRESDFDDRLKSFLGLLPRDVCEKAANEIPIPTQGLLKITMKNKHNKVFQVKINNMLGKEVFTHRLNPNKSVLNVYTAEWLNGAYSVSIYDESSLVFNQKVVVN